MLDQTSHDTTPQAGDIRALKHRIHELEGEVIGYKRMLQEAETAAQPEQQAEPVAWMRPSEEGYDSAFRDHHTIVTCAGNPWKGWLPLYTAPPAVERPWVGLTDEEIAQGNKESWVTEQAWQSAVWWAEAKLKEKNNG
jgi:hypothetical protein